MQEFFSRNLYFTCCLFSLIGGVSTYMYFYNKEVLLKSDINVQDTSLEEVKELVVDISGAIDKPGIYTLQNGQRLADLISMSGGVTSEVSQKWLSRNLNLSSLLKDQQKIYIPFEWEVVPSFPEYELKELALESSVPKDVDTNSTVSGGGGASSGSDNSSSESGETPVDGGNTSDGNADTLINLNSASKEELDTLPKVGEVTAQKIVDYRPYSGFEDLKEKTGIYDSVINAIKDLVVF